MPEFTEQYLLGLAPKDQAYDVEESRELAIRIFPNGIKTWVYRYSVGEYERRRTLGIFPEMTLERAREELPAARKIAALAQDIETRQDLENTTVIATDSGTKNTVFWKRGNVMAAAAAAALGFIALIVLIASQHEPAQATLRADRQQDDKVTEPAEPTQALDTSRAQTVTGEEPIDEIHIEIPRRYPEVYEPEARPVLAEQPAPETPVVATPPNELPPETVTDTSAASEIVKRAQFARLVENREPVDKLEQVQITWRGNEPKFFHFFSEFYDAEGQTLRHDWYLNGKLQTSVDFVVKSPHRWRVYSKKRITPDLVGEWRVDIVNAAGQVLHSDSFSLVPERRLADN